MGERRYRLTAIKKLIKENRINNQENLLDMLGKKDFSVTQATLSRDLKLLKVSKVYDGNSGYYYSLQEEELQKVSEERNIMDINRGFLSINFSINLGVIRTFSGHASTVALAIDNLEMEEIIGTIAGDDTVLLVIKEDLSSKEFLNILRDKFPALEI